MMDPNQPTQPPTESIPPTMPTNPPPSYPPPFYPAPYPPPPMWSPPPPPVSGGLDGSVRQTWNAIPPVVRWLVPILLITLVVASLGGVVLYQHLVAKPDGYLGTTSTEVVFIRLTEGQNGNLTGSLQTVSEQSDGTISTNDIGFTGTWNGSQVSLTFSVLGFYGIVIPISVGCL